MGTRKKYKSEKLMVFQINELSQLRYQRKEKEEDDVYIGFNQNKEKSSLFKEFWRVIKMKAQRLNVLYVYVWSIPVEPVIYTCITNVS